VTLFASADSHTKARLMPAETAIRLDPTPLKSDVAAHFAMLDEVRRRAHQFEFCTFIPTFCTSPCSRRMVRARSPPCTVGSTSRMFPTRLDAGLSTRLCRFPMRGARLFPEATGLPAFRMACPSAYFGSRPGIAANCDRGIPAPTDRCARSRVMKAPTPSVSSQVVALPKHSIPELLRKRPAASSQRVEPVVFNELMPSAAIDHCACRRPLRS
jgi:hypothetical protein